MRSASLYFECAELLRYEPDTGRLYWTAARMPSLSKVIGTVAGSQRVDGYTYVIHKGKALCSHRLAWLIHTGELPEQIDHINMIRSDNRFSNLRAATLAENNRNRGKQSNNTSGHKGVSFHRGTQKYHAKIMAGGVRHSLGYFKTADEAAVAYAKASERLHGKFARQ